MGALQAVARKEEKNRYAEVTGMGEPMKQKARFCLLGQMVEYHHQGEEAPEGFPGIQGQIVFVEDGKGPDGLRLRQKQKQ